jgi:two-component system response regulator RegX3
VTRILLVEDEESLSDPLAYLLRKEGYEVTVAGSGPGALTEFDRNGADLVLLDLMLPGLPGKDVCRLLREQSDVPIIMLTALGTENDKVEGLELGADDYVTKPFSSSELAARIRAVLRRRQQPEPLLATIVEHGPVRMDIERHAAAIDGNNVLLPVKEFELLEFFLRNHSRVLTRGELTDRIAPTGSENPKALDEYIAKLRARIEPDPSHPRHLLTVRGLGYKYEP